MQKYTLVNSTQCIIDYLLMNYKFLNFDINEIQYFLRENSVKYKLGNFLFNLDKYQIAIFVK